MQRSFQFPVPCTTEKRLLCKNEGGEKIIDWKFVENIVLQQKQTKLDTLTDEVEPFLLRTELIIRSPRGRVATAKAFQHLGMEGGSDSQRSLFD